MSHSQSTQPVISQEQYEGLFQNRDRQCMTTCRGLFTFILCYVNLKHYATEIQRTQQQQSGLVVIQGRE